ncbi:MAG: hypothetical protein MMC33_000210 [Icmadophila ericetorum]|nr:hypothetical protein [Icmadophila ericetorum]
MTESSALYDNQGTRVLIAAIIVYSLAIISVFLRFLSRKISNNGIWWDDWLALSALVFVGGLFTLTVLVVHYGLGKHGAVLNPGDVSHFFKILYIYEIIYGWAISAVKYSILFFYWRIFKVDTFRVPLYTMGVVCFAWFLAQEFGSIFKCIPASALWDSSVRGHCINLQQFILGVSVPNIVIDVALLVLPLPFVWGLQLNRSQKLAVSGIFLLGSFVTVASTIRFATFLNLHTSDPTWSFASGFLWTVIEPSIAIVSACLPSMRPILRFLLTGSVIPSKQPSRPTKSSFGNSSSTGSGSRINRWLNGGRGVSNNSDTKGSGASGIGLGSRRDGNGSFLQLPNNSPSRTGSWIRGNIVSVWAQSWKGSSEVDLESGNSDALEMNKANDSIAGIKVRREVEYQNCRE